jgi:hypothetical protein
VAMSPRELLEVERRLIDAKDYTREIDELVAVLASLADVAREAFLAVGSLDSSLARREKMRPEERELLALAAELIERHK